MERGIITITENGAVAMPTAPVWMTQQEMSSAFNVFGCDIRKAIRVIYKNEELLDSDTMRYIRQGDGVNYDVYSLEMIIAIAFTSNYVLRNVWLSGGSSWTNSVLSIEEIPSICSFRYPIPIHDARVRMTRNDLPV